MKVWENYLLIFSIHQTICIAGIFHSTEYRIDFYCLLLRPLFRLSYLNRLLIREISQLFPVEIAIFFSSEKERIVCKEDPSEQMKYYLKLFLRTLFFFGSERKFCSKEFRFMLLETNRSLPIE